MKYPNSAFTSLKGTAHEINDDSVLVDSDLGLFAVADGMGGCENGQLASRIAISTLGREISSELQQLEADKLIEHLRDVFATINDALREQAPGKSGSLGSTLTVAVAREDEVVLVHSGDSRAYLVENDCSAQLTDDHTVVGDLLRDGLISETEATNHPRRSILSGGMGISPTCKIHVTKHRFPSGAALVLCTDGLTTALSDQEIVEHVGSGVDAQDAANRLAHAAASNGSEDDITVIVICS